MTHPSNPNQIQREIISTFIDLRSAVERTSQKTSMSLVEQTGFDTIILQELDMAEDRLRCAANNQEVDCEKT